ncbi:MAG: 50S ribosomal protein L25 [Mycobacteriaceae bacterium]|nr:50S ribosomal protein L25 [Mycobacteriaceae bacterium]
MVRPPLSTRPGAHALYRPPSPSETDPKAGASDGHHHQPAQRRSAHPHRQGRLAAKAIAVHPIRRTITHADLIVVRRGEKVTVEVPVALEGEAANGTLVTQDSTTIEIEAEALSIPESLTVSIEGAEEGTQITAGQIALPEGVTLISDPEMLVVNIVVAPTAEDLEAEGAGEVSEAEGAEAAEGEAEPAEGEEAGASAGGESKPAEGE